MDPTCLVLIVQVGGDGVKMDGVWEMFSLQLLEFTVNGFAKILFRQLNPDYA